ncbi:MAG: DNA-directed RNA polymerase subunit omega [Verrucomicrobiota bacterium]|nr:DNA-directed RNA polymerase subunit omega [Verrucomicrobiota bacterium]
MRNLQFEEIIKERPDLTPEILVNAISQRVRQLNSGSRPLVFSTSKSYAEIALQEIMEKKLILTESHDEEGELPGLRLPKGKKK